MAIMGRLSSFSRSGPLPQADLSDEQYQELEAIYGVPLTKDAREKLKEICDFYVIWRQPEVDGQNFADVAALFKKVKAAVAAFTPLAFGTLTPLTDAGKQMNELLERHFVRFPCKYLSKTYWMRKATWRTRVWKIPDVSKLSFQWTLSCMSELRFKAPSIGLIRK